MWENKRLIANKWSQINLANSSHCFFSDFFSVFTQQYNEQQGVQKYQAGKEMLTLAPGAYETINVLDSGGLPTKWQMLFSVQHKAN